MRLTYMFTINRADNYMSTFDEDDIMEAIAEKCGAKNEDVEMVVDQEDDLEEEE